METRDAPIKLKKVTRLDCIALDTSDATYFTDEGYLVDHPILTSCGIFEYHEKDGSVRRELRLPENVFEEKSLKSYKGKPIIITHDAGVIDSKNVGEEIIGTILSDGYKDGEDVRAQIIIHDTDTMKNSGLRELSLGYNLDLVEQPGEWNGEKYDAIQTNIMINHLALVSSARAGEQARLNIDGSDEPTLKGGKVMKKYRKDGGSELAPEELEKAIALFKAVQPLLGNSEQPTADGEEEEQPEDIPVNEEVTQDADVEEEKPEAPVAPKAAPTEAQPGEGAKAEAPAEKPNNDLNAQVIAVLEKTIADLKAASGANTDSDGEEVDETLMVEETEEKPEEEEIMQTDEDDLSKSLAKRNADSVDHIISQKLNICRMGDKLNLDGLDNLSVNEGKKAIIKNVFPDMRLDGKSSEYLNAAYDMAVLEVKRREDTINEQRKQMFNGCRMDGNDNLTMAESARQRMLDREGGN